MCDIICNLKKNGCLLLCLRHRLLSFVSLPTLSHFPTTGAFDKSATNCELCKEPRRKSSCCNGRFVWQTERITFPLSEKLENNFMLPSWWLLWFVSRLERTDKCPVFAQVHLPPDMATVRRCQSQSWECSCRVVQSTVFRSLIPDLIFHYYPVVICAFKSLINSWFI